MKTFYEEIKGSGVLNMEYFPSDAESAMDRAEIFMIQNVADYVYETYDLETENMTFPNLAPPFEVFWMEFWLSPFIKASGKLVETEERFRVGCLVDSAVNDGGQDDDWKWVTLYTFFVGGKLGYLFLGKARVFVDADGSRHESKSGDFEDQVYIPAHHPDGAEEGLYQSVQTAMRPVMFAISLMHCKNVELVSGLPKFTKGTKKFNRYGPKIKYKVLQIEPMKKILHTEGQIEKNGLKQAMHICRGHFKDFSQGKGLFGKYRDVYWWESQVRGDLKHGMVMKDYKVNEPKE